MLPCVTHRDHSAPYRRRTNLTRAAPQCCPPCHPPRGSKTPTVPQLAPGASSPPPSVAPRGGKPRHHPPGAHRPPLCPLSAPQVQPCSPNAPLCHPLRSQRPLQEEDQPYEGSSPMPPPKEQRPPEDPHCAPLASHPPRNATPRTPLGGGEPRHHPPGAHRTPPCPPSAPQVQPCGPNAPLCHPLRSQRPLQEEERLWEEQPNAPPPPQEQRPPQAPHCAP